MKSRLISGACNWLCGVPKASCASCSSFAISSWPEMLAKKPGEIEEIQPMKDGIWPTITKSGEGLPTKKEGLTYLMNNKKWCLTKIATKTNANMGGWSRKTVQAPTPRECHLWPASSLSQWGWPYPLKDEDLWLSCIQWIGLRKKIYRKPWIFPIFPLDMGFSGFICPSKQSIDGNILHDRNGLQLAGW